MKNETTDGLEDLLSNIENQKKISPMHNIISFLFILFIAFLVYSGFSDQDIMVKLGINNFLGKGKNISIASSRGDTTLILLNHNTKNKSSEARIIDTRLNKIFDLSSGDADIVTASLSYTGSSVAYVKKSQKFYLREWRKQSESSSLSISFSDHEQLFNDKVKNKEINVCVWSKLKWSNNNKNIAFFLCSKKYSILATVKIDVTLNLETYYSTQSSIKSRRQVEWASKNLVFSTREINGHVLKKITPSGNRAKSVTLYNLPKK